jgi:hypothetical protein
MMELRIGRETAFPKEKEGYAPWLVPVLLSESGSELCACPFQGAKAAPMGSRIHWNAGLGVGTVSAFADYGHIS